MFEWSAETTRSGVVAAKLMVDARNPGTAYTPAPVRLQVCRGGNNECEGPPILGIGIVAVPVVVLGTA